MFYLYLSIFVERLTLQSQIQSIYVRLHSCFTFIITPDRQASALDIISDSILLQKIVTKFEILLLRMYWVDLINYS